MALELNSEFEHTTAVMTTLAQIEDFKQKTQLALTKQSAYIVKGSDDHLDLLLDIKGHIDSYIKLFEMINDQLAESVSPDNIDEFSSEKMSSLREMLEYSERLLTAMQNIDLNDDLATCYANYEAEVSQLRESIMDIESLINNQPGKDKILSILNDL